MRDHCTMPFADSAPSSEWIQFLLSAFHVALNAFSCAFALPLNCSNGHLCCFMWKGELYIYENVFAFVHDAFGCVVVPKRELKSICFYDGVSEIVMQLL